MKKEANKDANPELVLQQIKSPSAEESPEKLVHLALPVRLTHMANTERSVLEMACTYDIHPRGARLLSFRDVKVGDLITVERGRNKSVCQVVWTGDPGSALRGQFTVECVEGSRSPWEDELRQMQEHYLPVSPENLGKKTVTQTLRRDGQNRRRSQRFSVAGEADLAAIGGHSSIAGRVRQLSEHGCMITAGDGITPGTSLKIVLSIYDVSVALKGNVRYMAENFSMGVEFREIRHGDRPLLDYMLNEMKKPRPNDFDEIEVITDSLGADSLVTDSLLRDSLVLNSLAAVRG